MPHLDVRMRLTVGLGNPGRSARRHRHNIGARFVEDCAGDHPFRSNAKVMASIAELDGEWRCLLPDVAMNDSGRSVSAFLRYSNLTPEEMLVVHDEMDLPPGTARFKFGGGHGGHNGVRDIIKASGSADFWRLRIGIGHPGDKSLVTSYVLSAAPAQERHACERAMRHAACQLPLARAGDWTQAVQRLHAWKPEAGR